MNGLKLILDKIWKAKTLKQLQTAMKDYVFFTVFTVQKAEENFKYLGVFDTFFNINWLFEMVKF